MKNNKITVNSLVKSSQVKSSAKIVFLIILFILLFSISCKLKQNPNEPTEEPLIPEAYQGKYIGGAGKNILPKKDDVYDYSRYFETTSSNFIIYSKGDYYTMPIVLKDANNKGILYYEDKDKLSKLHCQM